MVWRDWRLLFNEVKELAYGLLFRPLVAGYN